MLTHTPWPLAVFEVGAYALFLLCLWHALRQGQRRRELLAVLLIGTTYGLILEAMTIQQFQSYEYGRFLVMVLGRIPFSIAVSWGTILYGTIAFADALVLTPAAWVAAVALTGLHIDLAMDAVAVRPGMWNWYAPGEVGTGPLLDLGRYAVPGSSRTSVDTSQASRAPGWTIVFSSRNMASAALAFSAASSSTRTVRRAVSVCAPEPEGSRPEPAAHGDRP